MHTGALTRTSPSLCSAGSGLDSGASDGEHVPLSAGPSPAASRPPSPPSLVAAGRPAVPICRPIPVHCQPRPAAAAFGELLPPPPPLRATRAARPALPAEALAQAHNWLSAILAQQQQERRWIEQYNGMLLIRALQEKEAGAPHGGPQRVAQTAAAAAAQYV